MPGTNNDSFKSGNPSAASTFLIPLLSHMQSVVSLLVLFSVTNFKLHVIMLAENSNSSFLFFSP